MGYRNYDTANGLLVDPKGNGDFTTIAGALAVVATGQTIFLRPGTYSESNTISTACNITAFDGDGAQSGNVTITGTFTVTAAITVNLSNLYLTTPATTYFLAVTGSAASVVNLTNCYLNCSVASGIHYTSSSGSSSVNLYKCEGNLGTTGIGLYVMSSAGTLNINYCNFANSGVSVTATSSSAGTVNIGYSELYFPISTSSTGSLGIQWSLIATTNATGVLFGGSGTSVIGFSTINSGTASSVSISNGATAGITACTFDSSNTNVITGAGGLDFSGLIFPQGATYTVNTTTQAGGAIQGIRAGNAPSAGYLGEQIRGSSLSGTGLSTTTITNLASVALTPGIWDISAIGQVLTTGNSTTLNFGISTTSTTYALSIGDAWLAYGYSSTTSASWGITIPAYRVTISSNTTYYANIECAFSSGIANGYARISATRVG